MSSFTSACKPSEVTDYTQTHTQHGIVDTIFRMSKLLSSTSSTLLAILPKGFITLLD